jgi:hypothetical protein
VAQLVEKAYCRALRERKPSEISLRGYQLAAIWQQNMIFRILKTSSVEFFNRLWRLYRTLYPTVKMALTGQLLIMEPHF